MTNCVFPGSFDPVTNGHRDLIARASEMFDHVTVTVMVNVRKTNVFSVDERMAMLRRVCTVFPNVDIDRWDGLLADYMRQKGDSIVIRGIRSTAEFEQELSASAANKLLNPNMETIFLPTDPDMSGISSSAVREVASFGGDISPFVPESVAEEIAKGLSKNFHEHT